MEKPDLNEITKKYSSKAVAAEAKDVVVGFKSFIKDYGVAPLAVAVVIGGAVNEFVKSVVDGLVYPLISLISSQGKLQSLQVTIHGATFKPGIVINSAISFLTVCIIVYFFVKYILRDEKILKK